MGEALREAIEQSVERLMNNFGSIHLIDLALLRKEKYPITVEDKEKLIRSLIVER